MNDRIFDKFKHNLEKLNALKDDNNLAIKDRLVLLECCRELQELLDEIKTGESANPSKNFHKEIPTEKKETTLNKNLTKLLIVDDDKDILRMLYFSLSRKGFEVICESDPVKALTEFEKINPEVILLDIMMPTMTGFEFLKHIKKKTKTKGIKILIGSSRDYEKDRITALEAGANDFISKPYNLKEISLKLNALLS